MTTKTYEWGHGGVGFYEWYELKDACEKLTGVTAADNDDAIQRLSQHYGCSPRIGFDEGISGGYEKHTDYFEGGHNDD